MLNTTYTTYIQPILIGTISKIIASLIIFIVTLILENKFGISKWLIRKGHLLINSNVEIKINVVYSLYSSFDNFKKKLRDVIRTRYKKIKVYNDTIQSLDVMVDDTFHIIASISANDEISIQTSKIASKMRNIKDDTHNILDTLNEAKEKLNAPDESPIIFKEKEFSLYLYLPYKHPFTKINPPKNIKIKDYELELIPEHGSIIKIKADFVNINAKYRHDLEKVVDNFV